MKIHLLFLLTLISCSTRKFEQNTSSKIGDPNLPDYSKTVLSIYPASDSLRGVMKFNTYLQLKNQEGKPITIEPKDVTINRLNGARVPFKFTRVAKGKAYFSINLCSSNIYELINFSINGIKIQSPLKLFMQQPHASTSKILMGNYTPGKASFKLHLLDSKKNPVQLNEKPEILFEGGLGSIEEIKMNEDFSWEFTLIHPENNPMLEFSVRAQGAYLKGLYRYTSAD